MALDLTLLLTISPLEKVRVQHANIEELIWFIVINVVFCFRAGRLSMDSSEGDVEVSFIRFFHYLKQSPPILLSSDPPTVVPRSRVPVFRRVRAPSLPPPPSSGTPCSAGRGPTHTPPTRWDTHLFPVERLVSRLESDHLVSLQGGKTQIIGPEEEEEEDDGYSINEVRESTLGNVLLGFPNWGSWVDEKEVIKARTLFFFYALLNF